MKYLSLTALVLAALALALPSVASAQRTSGANCDYAGSQTVTSGDLDPGAGQIFVYAGSGTSGEADLAAGACINTNTAADDFEGGTGEAGIGDTDGNGAYAVIDGDNDNVDPGPAPQGQSDGYIGVSNFETGVNDPSSAPGSPDGCSDGGTESNSGGCLGVAGITFDVPPALVSDPASPPPAPTPICGNTTGNQWEDSTRDGCEVP